MKRQSFSDFSQIFYVSKNEARFLISEKKTEIEHQITKLLPPFSRCLLPPFLYQSSISRSCQCGNNFVIWCSILVFFSEMKNSTSFCNTYRIWDKSDKLCRFKYCLLLRHKKREILIPHRRKISTFFWDKLEPICFQKSPYFFTI